MLAVIFILDLGFDCDFRDTEKRFDPQMLIDRFKEERKVSLASSIGYDLKLLLSAAIKNDWSKRPV